MYAFVTFPLCQAGCRAHFLVYQQTEGGVWKIKRYLPERKEAAIHKMMQPSNTVISMLAAEEGITEAALYNWRKQVTSGVQSWQVMEKALLFEWSFYVWP